MRTRLQTSQIVFRCPTDLKIGIQRLADSDRLRVSEVVRSALYAHLSRPLVREVC